MEGHGLVPRAPGAVDLRGADTPYTKRSMQLQSQNSLPTSSMSLPQSLLERGAHKALAVQQDATQQGPVVTSLNPAYATCTRSGVDGQLCVEVRLTPIHPLSAPAPLLLAAGMGNLFMAPSREGVLMQQWAAADTQLKVPEGLQRAHWEDPDAAPSGAVPVPKEATGKVMTIAVDEVTGTLWTGHKDRKVCRWSLKPEQGPVLQYVWQASHTSAVRALCVTPWGELWTGTDLGSVRVWAHAQGNGASYLKEGGSRGEVLIASDLGSVKVWGRVMRDSQK